MKDELHHTIVASLAIVYTPFTHWQFGVRKNVVVEHTHLDFTPLTVQAASARLGVRSSRSHNSIRSVSKPAGSL